MLLGGKQSGINQVAIVTRNQKFNRLLGSILADWKFFAVDDPSEAKVVFAERGIDLPNIDGQIIWLTPLPLSEGRFLLTPISLTRLYDLLEVHFFSTPRRHIRVAIEAKAGLKLGAAWQDCKLVSLSDRGCRIVCENEVTRGVHAQFNMKLSGRQIHVPVEILYCIPAGDSPGRSKPQAGLLFKPADESLIDMLRCYIERISVEAACAREEITLRDPSLSWFDIPSDTWQE